MAENPDLLHGKESQENKHRIQHLATQQLINSWKKHKDHDNDPFLWGDETECFLLRLDHSNHSAGPEQVLWLNLEAQQGQDPNAPALQPELGTHMLETTPSKPFGDNLRDLLNWQGDFAERRDLGEKVIDEDAPLVTLPYFPVMVQKGPAALVTPLKPERRIPSLGPVSYPTTA